MLSYCTLEAFGMVIVKRIPAQDGMDCFPQPMVTHLGKTVLKSSVLNVGHSPITLTLRNTAMEH